jgi:hypothetical protein
MIKPTPVQEAFEAYTKKVGGVVYHWNYLQEKLGRLFVIVREGDKEALLAEWRALRSDAGQRCLLRKAIRDASIDRWKERPDAPDALNWLLDRANEFAEHRNNAIHAPCSLYLNEEGASEVWAANKSATPHPRAKNLEKKRLVAEFSWCAACTQQLAQYAEVIGTAIAVPDQFEWPERPQLLTPEDFSGELPTPRQTT